MDLHKWLLLNPTLTCCSLVAIKCLVGQLAAAGSSELDCFVTSCSDDSDFCDLWEVEGEGATAARNLMRSARTGGEARGVS